MQCPQVPPRWKPWPNPCSIQLWVCQHPYLLLPTILIGYWMEIEHISKFFRFGLKFAADIGSVFTSCLVKAESASWTRWTTMSKDMLPFWIYYGGKLSTCDIALVLIHVKSSYLYLSSKCACDIGFYTCDIGSYTWVYNRAFKMCIDHYKMSSFHPVHKEHIKVRTHFPVWWKISKFK